MATKYSAICGPALTGSWRIDRLHAMHRDALQIRLMVSNAVRF